MTKIPFHLFTAPCSHDLAKSIAVILDHPISPCSFSRFADGESTVRLDVPVRGRPVFIIQSTAPPVTENLFQLLQFIDAARRARASSITAIVPYLGYSRADRGGRRREALTANMVAELLQNAGLDHLITVDLHTSQIEGFYRIPVDNLSATSLLCHELSHLLPSDTVVVSPDAGWLKTASVLAQRLGCPVAVLLKNRDFCGKLNVQQLVGHVQGHTCLLIDDMITTGHTIHQAVTALLEAGAQAHMIVAATHGVFVEHYREQLDHPAIREIIITDTIAPHASGLTNIRTVSVAPLLAAAIQRLTCAGLVNDFS